MLVSFVGRLRPLQLDKTIREFVEKLRTCMPKQCKLPRSDYGSPGNRSASIMDISLISFLIAILQYYLHQLHEVIHYPALQDVFHCFRELGNAILLFIMIEQSLVNRRKTSSAFIEFLIFSHKKKSKICYKRHRFRIWFRVLLQRKVNPLKGRFDGSKPNTLPCLWWTSSKS